MSVIIKPVQKVVGWVGDTVTDAVDWVVDDIIDPVVETVEGTIDAALDDPIKTIATVAAIATGQAWAIPLIEGADVAIDGGDIGDVLEATAKAYVAQQVGAAAGKYAGQAAGQAASDAAIAGGSTASTAAGHAAVASAIVGGGAQRATQAAIYGQDPVEAAMKGGMTAGISASLGQLGETSAYKQLPKAAQSVIADTLTATLTGQEVSPELITSAIIKGAVTAETVNNFLDPSLNEDWDEEDRGGLDTFTDGQIAAITNTIHNTATAALTGREITPALIKSVIQYGRKELNKSIDKTVRNTIDDVSGNYDETAEKANQVDDSVDNYETAAANYNATADEYAVKKQEQEELETAYETAKANYEEQPTERNEEIANEAVAAYNNYTTNLNKELEEKYQPLLDQYKVEADTALANVNTYRDEYIVLKDKLVSSGEQLDNALIPVQKNIDKSFVRAMTNDAFNEEEYVNLNNLDEDSAITGEDFDAYYHWLTTGKELELPVNSNQYESKIKKERHNNFVTSLKNGENPFASAEYSYPEAINLGGRTNTTNIIENNATLTVDEDGEIFFEEYDALADADPRWSNEAGGLVTDRFNAENQRFETVSVDTGEVVAEEDRSFTFDDMKDLYPEQYIKTISTFDDEAGAYINQLENKNIHETSKNAVKFANVAYVDENDKSSWWRNTAVSLVKALPQAVDTANRVLEYGHGLLKYGFGGTSGQAGQLLASTVDEKDIGPISENVVKLTNSMINLAEDQNTEAYKQNIALFDNAFEAAPTALDKLGVVFNGVLNAPDMLVLDKVVEPAIAFLTGSGTLKVGKTVKEIGDTITKNLVPKVGAKKSKEFGNKFEKVAANIKNNLKPSGGAAAISNTAQENIIVSGAATFVLSEALKDADFEELFSSSSEVNNIPAPILEKLKDTPENTFVDEFTDYQQYKFSDNTDNEQYNTLIKTSELFGLNNNIYQVDDYNPKFVKRQTNDLKLNALTVFNPNLESIISNAENAPEENKEKYITQANEFLSASNVDNAKKTNVFNFIAPTQYQTKEEIKEKIQTIAPSDFTFEEDTNIFTGKITDADVESKISEYVDERYTDREEVKEAYKKAGLGNPTEFDISHLIGQTGTGYDITPDIEENLLGAQYRSVAKGQEDIQEQLKKLYENDAQAAYDKQLGDLLTYQNDAQATYDKQLRDIMTYQNDAQAAFDKRQEDLLTYQNDAQAAYDKQQQDLTTFADDTANMLANQIAEQNKANVAARAAQAQRGQQMNVAQQLYGQLQPQTAVPQKPVEVAEIGSPYGFESIFRDAAQQAFYKTPYNKGGQVDNLNDTLLKLIGDK
jgi:hypothetical protein